MDVSAYADALWALLPPGPAWSRDDPLLAAWVMVSARRLAAIDDALQRLQSEADPRTTLAMLPGWEASHGLPDSCGVGSPTLSARRAAIVARQNDVGGARTPRFVQIADALGYPNATTTRFRMHTCEADCEQPVNDVGWRFVWTLNLLAETREVDNTCESTVEEPLRTWGDAVLDCMMQREAPAQSQVFITYGS